MSEFEEYKKQEEPERYKKAQNWGVAIGLQQVDNLTPSKYLIEVAKDNIEGKISIDEANEQVSRYYKQNPAKTPKEQNEKEADEVSARIAKLLSTHTFTFSPAELISIHRFLFTDILDYKIAGKIRDYEITKNEPVLNGDTVIYGRSDSIRETLDYDFDVEKNFNYNGLTDKEKINRIEKFISGLWQIHPFGEGNTRTTAVFTIKYLYTLGFETNNDLFEKHAKYFRNALVRANYQNLKINVQYSMKYLDKFFGNLLFGENNILDNREIQILTESEKSSQKSSQKSSEKIVKANTQNITEGSPQKSSQKNSKKSSQKILELILQNKNITTSEIAMLLNISRRAVAKQTASLKAKGLLKRIGPDNGGHWEVIKP